MKNLTWQNPEQLFVAQELINKVKSKCCGIKVHQPYRKSVFLGDCGSPGLQEMKGCIYMSKDSKLIFQGFTVISQGSVLRVDNNSTIVLGNDFYCNKNCFLRSSSLIKFGKNCSLGWNVQINNNDGHEITHDAHVSPQIGDVIIGDHVWLTSNTISNCSKLIL